MVAVSAALAGVADAEGSRSGRSIEQSVIVRGDASEVFAMWTDVETTKRFLAPDGRIEARVGGRYEMVFRPEVDPEGESFGTKGAKVLAYEPGKRLSFEWRGPPWAEPMNTRPLPTRVELTFEPASGNPGHTRVRLTHSGFGQGEVWDRAYAFFDRNWGSVLERFERFCFTERASAVHGLSRGGGERVINKAVTIAAPVADVWGAWTTSEGMASFFAKASTIELRVGGRYELYIVPDAPAGSRGSEGCHILSYVPKEMLSFEWNAPPSIPSLRDAGVKTFVVLRFDELGARQTRVRLSHLGMGEGEAWDKYYAYFDRAWDVVLKLLHDRFASESVGEPESARHEGKHWVYYIRPSRDGFFGEGGATDFENKKIEEHAAYLKGLLDEGTLVLAGPSFDPVYYPGPTSGGIAFEIPTPGIVVFKADSVDAARRIMENDPAVKAGVFKARLNELKLVFHAE
jgi:uncharacterized protein YndB with AHSA1/START domain/uncharacterized protein YciI